jgi:hypothetical protein
MDDHTKPPYYALNEDTKKASSIQKLAVLLYRASAHEDHPMATPDQIFSKSLWLSAVGSIPKASFVRLSRVLKSSARVRERGLTNADSLPTE